MLNFKNMDAIDYLKTIDNESIDLILTDLPYLISRKTGFKSVGKKGIDRFSIEMEFGKWDCQPIKEHISLLKNVFKESYRVMKDGGVVIAFYDLWKIQILKQILENNQFCMFRFIEWVKTNPVPINSKILYLSNSREVAVVCVKKGKPKFKSQYHNGIFSGPIHRDGGKRLHPTQKPLVLMTELINIHTDNNDNILDMFAGSGTTLLAGIKIGRNVFGCELDPIYYKKANKRIKDFLKNDGQIRL